MNDPAIEALPSNDDVRMAVLAPVVAAELGLTLDEAEDRIREVCAELEWAIQEVGHA